VTELQQNRYDALLRRVGDLKGPGSKVNDVLQELFPVIDVERVPGELLFLMGTRIGHAGTSLNPAPAQRGGIQLFNPVGSGKLITISRLILSASSSQTITWGVVTIGLTTNTGLARSRDGRGGVGPSGVAQLRTAINAVAPIGMSVIVPAGGFFQVGDVNSVAVLSPGTGLSVVAGVDDLSMNTSFYYRERVAEPSELNF